MQKTIQDNATIVFHCLKDFLKKTSNDLKFLFLSKQIKSHLYNNIFLGYKNFENWKFDL
jgi:hypothetical protein